jgi:hypothetical protein
MMIAAEHYMSLCGDGQGVGAHIVLENRHGVVGA